jgi:predicted Fe-Mo cluster-binding NifX family protein
MFNKIGVVMRVLMPVIDNENEKHNIANGFFNTNYVCVYDSENQSYEWLATEEISKKIGNISLELKRKGIEAIISNDITFMALGLFVESGLKVYKAKGQSVQENINFLHDKELDQFTPLGAMSSASCHGSCSSCNTSCS